jgi:sulfoxide reductase heme-binding subunit YedZ
MNFSSLALWNDRRGRFSFLRALVLIALFLPALDILVSALEHNLGPRPYTEAIHRAGLWTIRFLLLTLAVTPFRRLARYPLLMDVRRMMGVAVFCYIMLHFALYIADQAFDLTHVASEIVARIYLTIGFTALVGLTILAATSNDTMVKKLGGRRWRHLHWLVYPIAVLGLIHYFMQSKLEVAEPTVASGLFVWLMLYRLMHWTLPHPKTLMGEFPLWSIGLIGVVAALLTVLGEAIGYGLVYGAPIGPVLQANLHFDAGLRPGWYVLIASAIPILIGLWRLKFTGPRRAAPE